MADVYVLYSYTLGKYYIGSCTNIELRLQQHLQGSITGSFTSKASDWKIFLTIKGLSFKMARSIESHIKRMKSKKYIESLKNYPEIVKGLISRYSINER